MTFEKYLAMHRHRKVEFTHAIAANPAADDFAHELNLHLGTVSNWINHGGSNRSQMLAAMKFFKGYFGSRYQAKPGAMLYRGQGEIVFDGSPRSDSTEPSVAQLFACSTSGRYVIRRKVCHSCQDRPAYKLTLDLGKLLSRYGMHKYGFEKEVVILNTRPRGSNASVSEVTCL